jgi:2-keto-4-pentenoate hydratase/2-oxohepta-3-ene-1,7-dioic acid hydratase in catechol pathway
MVIDEAGNSIVAVSDLAGRVLNAPIGINSGSLAAYFDDWESSLSWLKQARDFLDTESAAGIMRHPIEGLRVLAPHLARQILCVGANYRTHVIEMLVAQPSPRTKELSIEQRRIEAARMMDERAATGEPYAFSKLPSCIAGPFDPITLPVDVKKPDWELELALVIGRRARRVSRHEALSYVAGFAIANDLTARERVYRPDIPDLATDFLAGKSSPGFLPFGPWITPREFVDHADLDITLALNGKVMQKGHTSDMVFDIPRQIEYLSSRVELWPGDIICTGSPAGNGMHHHRFLQPGDEMEGSISGLGSIKNRCLAE